MKNESNQNKDYHDPEEMKGQRMTFQCYRKVIPAEPHDIETLIDSHDNDFIIPCREAETFRKDAWTWSFAIHCAEVHNCSVRNGDRRIELSGRVEEVRPNVLILSDLDYEYKDTPLTL